MSIRVAIRHRTRYKYDRPIQLSPQLVRLRPAPHCRTKIHSYNLKVEPNNHFINWQQDPFGNHIARFVFPEKIRELSIDVEIIADMTVINPFDFFVEEYAENWPFKYDAQLEHDLKPYLKVEESGEKLKSWMKGIDTKEQRIVTFLVALNQRLQESVDYTVRLEPGIQTCEETLTLGTGSCRDSAWVLVQVLRNLGLAARFVSGYLVQLVSDVKSLDGPQGPTADFTDLHAWAEVFIPGAGWVGLDATSGLLAGEGHIPLCCTSDPASAAPLTGLMEPCETEFEWENSVTRILEDPRVTKPFTDEQWQSVLDYGETVDAKLEELDVRLTQGGEPTFVSIDNYDAPEWNTAALGKQKESLARQLLHRLREQFAKGSVLHLGQGKWYPGEELPRWAYSCFFRADGEPLLRSDTRFSPDVAPGVTLADAQRFSKLLVQRLQVSPGALIPAYENAAHYLDIESKLPSDVDPLTANLKDPLERRRLAKLINKGLNEATGFVLPLHRHPVKDAWHSAKWVLKNEKMLLVPGDSPMGYRLPLASLLTSVQKKKTPQRDPFDERIPFSHIAAFSHDEYTPPQAIQSQEPPDDHENVPHTALCVEPRDGRLWVFLPPVTHIEHWIELIHAIEDCARECKIPVDLEGYEPPNDPRVRKLAVTPDPGVIEVNIHPSSNWQELVSTTKTVYEEARLTRLGAEKFMLDGRHTGTGGGNHITLGSAEPVDSPFLRRPDLLASLLVFWQNHPSLSYLFSGLFIGPTSQAPRIDEARNDTLYELEIALEQIQGQEECQPWQVDRLFRNLLVDITGNTHRSEFCIDKMYSPSGATGRLGILEFRAFEMPPHWQMSLAQSLLLRTLVACFWQTPYKAKPIHWGTALHDRFMLPYYVTRDFHDVLNFINDAGFALDPSWYDSFTEFRFPHYGTIEKNSISMSLHGAIEPWHVLGEEVTAHGTSRYVDSSLERLQVSVKNFNPERFSVSCNGRHVPLQATQTNGEYVAGVRFKAWQAVYGLHPLLPADAPLTFEIIDKANRKSMGGCTYHVAHPSGRNYDTFPINANEAESRRIARFWDHGHTMGKITLPKETHNRQFPCTLDMRKKGD